MKTLIAGTFDNFHVGHQWLIWSAFERSEELVIIVARDKTVEKIKKQLPKNTEDKRLQRVLNEVKNYPKIRGRLGRLDGQFDQTIAEENPDKILLGYDQQFSDHLKSQFGSVIKFDRINAYQPQFFKSSKF